MGEQSYIVTARNKLSRQKIDDALDAAIVDRRNRNFRIDRQSYTQLYALAFRACAADRSR